MFIKIKPVIKAFVPVIVAVFAAGATVFAWTEPGSSPPSGNVAGPINTSGGTQTKAGDLVLPNLYLNAIGSEGNIYNANIVQGYNDLFLRSNSAENATLYLSGSQLDFWSGTPSQPRWSINSAGTLNIGSVPWARLISLPSACPAGQYVSAVGSSLTCSAPGGGSQWTTSGSNIYYTSGNVGIGVAGPISKLWVGNSVSDPFLIRLMSGTGIVGDKTGIGFGANWTFSKAGIYFENIGGNTGNLVFANTNQTDSADFYLADAYKRMVITSAGSVGIGTTAPNAKLAVGGAGSVGDAVAAYANSANSALYAEQAGTGYAGYFSGKVRFSSDIVAAGMANCPIVKTDSTGLLSCNFSSYLTSEADPQVGTITTSGKWCTTDGSQINCASDAPAGGVGGSGTANYVPKFTAGTTLGNSIIYDSGIGVGIGTAAPGALLNTYNANSGDQLKLQLSSNGQDNYTGIKFTFGGTDRARIEVYQPRPQAYGDMNFYTAGSDGLNNRMTVKYTGNVGIGDTSPANLLTVGSGDLFQVNSSGNLVKVNNVSYSWPANQGAASTYLKNDGSGNLSWTAAAGGGVNSYAYSANSSLDILPPNFDWQDITSRILTNVPVSTLLVMDANASIQMLYNNWPDGVSTVLNGRMRITVNGTEQKICYVNSPAISGWDYGNCSISTIFLTPAAGSYTIRLQGRKTNADHQASFLYSDLRVIGLPYAP